MWERNTFRKSKRFGCNFSTGHILGNDEKKSRELDGDRASMTFYVRPSVYFILEMIGNYQYRVLNQRVIIRFVLQKATLVVLWKRYHLGASWNSQAPQRGCWDAEGVDWERHFWGRIEVIFWLIRVGKWGRESGVRLAKQLLSLTSRSSTVITIEKTTFLISLHSSRSLRV